MKRLLIQACSGRKNATAAPVPAFELYDGVAFRVMKKYLRENSGQAHNLDILILSAEYGLISSDNKITTYDRRMTVERAESLKTQVFEFWKSFGSGRVFNDIFINVGRDYLQALKSIYFPTGAEFASGGIGYRNRQLKNWLWKN